MKTLKLFSLFVAAAFSVTIAKAQTADEIVAKHIEAIGGADNWKKVNSMVQTGSMSIQGFNIDVVVTILHQKGVRRDITAMGMGNYVIVTPAEGWMYMPIQQKTEVEQMPEEQLKQAQEDLDAHGSFVDYKQKGHTVELVGSEEIGGTDCFKIKMTTKAGNSIVHYIDKKTSYVVQTMRTAEGIDLITTYSNFQKLPEGVVVPMSSVLPLGPGMTADYTVSKVEINKPVDESIFKPAK